MVYSDTDLDRREVIEPEVLPPAPAGEEPRGEKPKPPNEEWKAWTRTMAPIFVGLLIDGVDMATMSPLGLRMGFIVGPLAAWAIASMYNMPMKYKILFSLGAAVYCTMPGTERLPLGTILGFFLKFKKPS